MHSPAASLRLFFRPFRLRLAALLTTAWLCALPAVAQDFDAAQALWLQGQKTQALQTVQAALLLNPNDAKLRFAQAVMQMELGQASQAEAGLLALTQDYPDLADPFNNLAVLYAGRGELDLAHAALEQAVRLQPEHAQAQENLGDVLLRMAARAYGLALKHGSGDTSTLQLKLSRLQNPAPAAAPR